MLTTDTLQPATPPAPAAAPIPSPTAPVPITDAPSFLSALIAARFDFRAVARTVEINLLLHLMRAPELMAAITEYARHAAAADALREADYRQIALDHLATLIRASATSPHFTTPLETRRAASSILRASNPPRENRAPRILSTPNLAPAPNDSRPRPPSVEHRPSTDPLDRSETGAPGERREYYPPGYPYPKTTRTTTTTASNHSTRPLAPVHTPAPPAALPSPTPKPTPTPTRAPATRAGYQPVFTPSPRDTAHDLVASLVTNFAASGDNNFGLRCIELFLDNAATINAIPLPVGDRDATVRQLSQLPLFECQGGSPGQITESSIEPPGAAAAHAVIRLSAGPLAPRPQSLNLILSLTRSPTSRLPNCWLIAHARIEPIDTS